jgi:F-type H+-transporting ATPase subunit delta
VAGARPALARRYAEALYDALESDEARAGALVVFRRLAELWRREREVRVFLAAPYIAAEKRVQSLGRILGAPLEHPLDFVLAMLLERRRQDLLALMPRAFEDVLDQRQGVTRVVVTTALALDAPARDRVEAVARRVAGGPVRLEEQTDPSLLGGLRLRIGDRLLDLSLSAQLARMVQWVAAAPLTPAPPAE